jgi:hypothetical protein
MRNVVPIKRHRSFARVEKRSAARTLSHASKAALTEVVVIGVDDEGELIVSAHPNDPGNAMWLMERAKKHLLSFDE